MVLFKTMGEKKIIYVCRRCGEDYIKLFPECKLCNNKSFQEVTYIDMNELEENESN